MRLGSDVPCKEGISIIIGAIVLVVLLFGLLGRGMMMGWMGPGMMGWGGYFNPIGILLMLVFWALAIGGIALLVLWLIRQAGAAGPGEGRALEVLRERYARGEITREQYEQMRRDLQER